MLSANKNVTLTEFQIKTLEIREKELNYFVSLYNSISGILHSFKPLRYCCNACWLRVFISQNELSAQYISHHLDHLPCNHDLCHRS